MFTKIKNAVEDFKTVVDSSTVEFDKARSEIISTYREGTANEKISKLEKKHADELKSYRKAASGIVESTINSIENYLELATSKYDVENVRDLKTILDSATGFTEREKAIILKDYDKCYLSHRIILSAFGEKIDNPVEKQISLLEGVRNDMFYVINGYIGRLNINHPTADDAAMIRILSGQNFEKYLIDFDSGNPYVTSEKVRKYLTPNTPDENSAIDALFEKCTTYEEVEELVKKLVACGMMEKLIKTRYRKYITGNSGAVESLLDSVEKYKLRETCRNLCILGLTLEIKNSKYEEYVQESI